MRKSLFSGFAGLAAIAGLLLLVPSTALAAAATASAAVNSGSLVLGTPASVSFGAVTLDGSAKTASVTPSCSGSANSCVEVIDATGSGTGWNLQVSATQFTQASGTNTGKTLDATALSVPSAPSVAAVDATSTVPTSGATIPATITTTPAKVVTATANTGMGSFNVPVAYQLAVRADAFAGTYTSTLTYSLTSAP
jgi:hypothetical protein